jgi:UDP-N-acetylmuramyl pentapeptide phosphotransferase/UDP-N-acetylglucosamine-1-phosphate transferase
MIYLIYGFLITAFLTFLILKLNSYKIGLDHDTGVQKFHSWKAVRIGGLPIYISLWLNGILVYKLNGDVVNYYFKFLIASTPVFLGGILEDFTKKVGPKERLIAAFASGVLVYFLIDTHLTRVDIPGLDYLLSEFVIFSIAFTAFALTGSSNAINIIDGFNGLASGVAIIIFSAYAYVSYLVGDVFLFNVCLIIIGALIGFFVLNFPYGKIFLGDGGAYLIGFLAGLIGVMLVERHKEVSAWFPLLLLMYPIYETLFSIYRRRFLGSYDAMRPDAIHLHTLIHTRIVRKTPMKENVILNSLTSPYLWFLELMCAIPAVLFYDNAIFLVIFSVLFAVFYTWLYFRLVKFKVPTVMFYLLRAFKWKN